MRVEYKVFLGLVLHIKLKVWRRSILVNRRPPAIDAKTSSTRGSGYWSTFSSFFRLPLKSPHRRTEPSFLATEMTGEAHSLQSTFVRRRSISAATLSRSVEGSGQALKNRRLAPSTIHSLALSEASSIIAKHGRVALQQLVEAMLC